MVGYYVFIRPIFIIARLRVFYNTCLRVFYYICNEPQQNLGRGLMQRKTGLSPPTPSQ